MSPMRKRTLTTGFGLLLLAVCILPTSAQVQPYIGVFFDEFLTQETKDCPGAVLDTLYVALFNANGLVTNVSYKVVLPLAITPLADITGDLDLLFKDGISFGTGTLFEFAQPQNGFIPIRLPGIRVQWTCTDCSGFDDALIVVEEAPVFGHGCPSYSITFGASFSCAVGLTAVVCPNVLPVEETTWGKVKALYTSSSLDHPQ